MEELIFGNKVNFKILNKVDIRVCNEINTKNSNGTNILKKLGSNKRDLIKKVIFKNKIIIRVLANANTWNLIIKFNNGENIYKEPDFKKGIIV